MTEQPSTSSSVNIFSRQFYPDQITIVELAFTILNQNMKVLEDIPPDHLKDRADCQYVRNELEKHVVVAPPTRRRSLKEFKFATEPDKL